MSGPTRPGTAPIYVCGQTPREFDRLALQSQIYDAVTRRLLVRAGIGAGQSVVDLGCGGGDVTRIAAGAVGPAGLVTGVDRSAEAVAAAAHRAAHLPHVRVVAGDIDVWQPAAPVDAVIGRFVLMHQRDPTAVLSRVRSWVRPGGVVAFIESDLTACQAGMHSQPHSATYQRIVDVWQAVLRSAGAHLDMGARLRAVFEAAGLSDPSVEVDVYTAGDPASPIFRFAVESLRSMLPTAAAAGIAAPGEQDLDRLEAALREELAASLGVLSAPPAHAVWASVR